MKITRSTSKHGSLCPSALGILSQIPSGLLHCKQHQLRHPESIYRFALIKLAERFCSVFDELSQCEGKYRLNRPVGGAETKALLAAHHNLLHSLREHVDELWMILKTLVNPAAVSRNEPFNDRYVIAGKLPGAKSFEQAIGPYKASLHIVNLLKHQQGILRDVTAWTTRGPYFGYILEEPDGTGAIGPSPTVHPDQKAISFARDLLSHLFSVYACSDKLTKAIEKVLSSQGVGLKAAPNPGVPEWNRVLEMASSLRLSFFPSELSKGIPFLRIDDERQELSFEFLRRVQVDIPLIKGVSCSTVIDGHNTKFNTPLV